MSTDPEQIRTDIAALLTGLPEAGDDSTDTVDIDAVAVRLEQAHELLVHALESVEGRGDTSRER